MRGSWKLSNPSVATIQPVEIELGSGVSGLVWSLCQEQTLGLCIDT